MQSDALKISLAGVCRKDGERPKVGNRHLPDDNGGGEGQG